MKAQAQQRKNRLMPNGVPKYVRVYDNQGKTFDRYTVVFTGRYNCRVEGYQYLGMSEQPFAPQGFGQHGEGKDGPIDKPGYSHLGKKIKFSELSVDAQKCAIQSYKSIWKLN